MTKTTFPSPVKYLKKGERIYHHYEQLEEFHAGMWKIVRGEMRKKNIDAASDLMRCTDEFKEAMRAATSQWVKSCEFNLTSDAINRLAWLGHAGCCIAVSSPEENTRAAWHTLNKSEQDEANRVAAEVLKEWVDKHLPRERNLFEC